MHRPRSECDRAVRPPQCVSRALQKQLVNNSSSKRSRVPAMGSALLKNGIWEIIIDSDLKKTHSFCRTKMCLTSIICLSIQQLLQSQASPGRGGYPVCVPSQSHLSLGFWGVSFPFRCFRGGCMICLVKPCEGFDCICRYSTNDVQWNASMGKQQLTSTVQF